MASQAAAAAAAGNARAANTTHHHVCRLEAALTRFRKKRSHSDHDETAPPSNTSRKLEVHRVCFKNNRAMMVDHLTAFLCNGKNRDGHAVYELYLNPCTFDTESLLVLCKFFASNKSPNTLQSVSLESSWAENGQADAIAASAVVYEIILPAFHNNNTVKQLSISTRSIRGTTGGAMVGDLLWQNKTLTSLELSVGTLDVTCVDAMREGLLATRCRLQHLGLQCNHIGSEVLQQLQLIYESNHDQHSTVLSELDLCLNSIQGTTGGNHMRRLLLTLPGLKKLVLSCNNLGPDGARALFAVDPTVMMNRLQSLDLGNCNIGNVGLAQMVASMPESSSTPLVYLNLTSNDIQGHAGGESLAHLLHCCEQLETLRLFHNRLLGPEGARALAPALARHCSLQNLHLDCCFIGDSGATEILKSLLIPTITNTRPANLKTLQLGANSLSPTILVSLTDYLKGAGRSLEELHLYGNEHLFETANDDQRRSFFEALANHKIIHFLGLTCCVMNEQSKESLLSALLQNTSLLFVAYCSNVNRLTSITAEYMRRNKLLSKMKTTMDKKPVDVSLPLALWPVALDVASPARCENQIGPTVAFCLIQKMMVSNVYSHTAAVYRFEKVRACTRVQLWWRRRLQALWIEVLNTLQLTIKI